MSGLLGISDLSPCTAAITAAYTELGIHTAFIVLKAKNENRRKNAMKLVKDLAKKYGIEAVVKLAEIVLND